VSDLEPEPGAGTLFPLLRRLQSKVCLSGFTTLIVGRTLSIALIFNPPPPSSVLHNLTLMSVFEFLFSPFYIYIYNIYLFHPVLLVYLVLVLSTV
jgi:hypothetical protein